MIRSEHFKLQELLDKATFELYGDDAWALFPNESIMMIDGIRDFFGVPVTCNNWLWGGSMQYRGYRPPDCPVGAAHSYHKSGRAFDFDVRGMTAEHVRTLIIMHKDDPMLKLINRLETDVSWVHTDSAQPPEGKSRIYLFRG